MYLAAPGQVADQTASVPATRRRPPLRGGRCFDAADQVNLRVEDSIHILFDTDPVFGIPAMTEAQLLLQALAPRYGYDPGKARYMSRCRDPALSFLSGERTL